MKKSKNMINMKFRMLMISGEIWEAKGGKNTKVGAIGQ